MIIIFYNLILEVDSYIAISGSIPRIEANFFKSYYHDQNRIIGEVCRR